MAQVICYQCHTADTFEGKLGFRAACPKCGEDLHVCLNCDMHDPKVYNECREPSADVVREKSRSNFCDFFTPKVAAQGGQGTARDALLSAAEALFKKK